MKNKRVIVTGGAGFIGSNLVEKLSKYNEVIIIDNLSTGRMENIQELLKKKNVDFISGSILDLDLLLKSFKDIDYVFHEAAMVSVPESIKDPILNNIVNINGTLNVLIASKENRVNKVVYASSCAVYGDSNNLPISETTIVNPKSPYAISKLTGEYYCSLFSRLYNLPTICLRYFNVYGCRQNVGSDYAAVIPKFINIVIDNKKPIIYGDGLQTRDFVFVDDIVRANILAAKSDYVGIFNIGTGVNTSIIELLQKIYKLLGKYIEPIFEKPREGDIKDSISDIKNARSFGFEHKYPLEKGLEKLTNYIIKNK